MAKRKKKIKKGPTKTSPKKKGRSLFGPLHPWRLLSVSTLFDGTSIAINDGT